ncbi:MAG TPA: winged helix DNA-binding domain-containing protein [Thermoanaerobaculia bacterium]|nr:winged helix DNA-binding domain-containing protein [Thermoanaerobaculia bacterium]
MPAPTLTLRQLNRATLARQMLLRRERTTALAAIERLAGLQAQLARPPFVGLWSRVAGFRREDLTRLLASREVVRATAMRGTLHLLSARDYVRLRASLQPMLDRGMQSILKERAGALDIPALVEEARAFFAAEPRTFEELRDHLLELHPGGDERAMGYAVRTHLPLVQVPADTPWGYPGTTDFAVAEAWLGEAADAGDPAPHALALRYLAAFGPASVADVQAWSGLQGLRATLEDLRPDLLSFRDERGKELFDLPDAPRPSPDVPAPARFLPEYDNLIVSRADARFVAERDRKSIFLPGLRVLPTFLVDGFAAGTWKVERKKAAAALLLQPFAALPKAAREELAAEGEALLRFVESDAASFEVRFARVVN